MKLTDDDQKLLAEADELGGADPLGIRERTGEADIGLAYAVELGRAKYRLRELVRLVRRLEASDG